MISKLKFPELINIDISYHAARLKNPRSTWVFLETLSEDGIAPKLTNITLLGPRDENAHKDSAWILRRLEARGIHLTWLPEPTPENIVQQTSASASVPEPALATTSKVAGSVTSESTHQQTTTSASASAVVLSTDVSPTVTAEQVAPAGAGSLQKNKESLQDVYNQYLQEAPSSFINCSEFGHRAEMASIPEALSIVPIAAERYPGSLEFLKHFLNNKYITRYHLQSLQETYPSKFSEADCRQYEAAGTKNLLSILSERKDKGQLNLMVLRVSNNGWSTSNFQGNHIAKLFEIISGTGIENITLDYDNLTVNHVSAINTRIINFELKFPRLQTIEISYHGSDNLESIWNFLETISKRETMPALTNIVLRGVCNDDAHSNSSRIREALLERNITLVWLPEPKPEDVVEQTKATASAATTDHGATESKAIKNTHQMLRGRQDSLFHNNTNSSATAHPSSNDAETKATNNQSEAKKSNQPPNP